MVAAQGISLYSGGCRGGESGDVWGPQVRGFLVSVCPFLQLCFVLQG